MDRLEQIKNEVAKEAGYPSWKMYMDDEPYGASGYVCTEVARRYATEVARHNLERAADRAKTLDVVTGNSFDQANGIRVDKQSILKLEIELI